MMKNIKNIHTPETFYITYKTFYCFCINLFWVYSLKLLLFFYYKKIYSIQKYFTLLYL